MSNENQEVKQELVFVSTAIVAYDPFRSQLADLKAGNAKAVFDYRDAKGNKEARSHIYKLRQTKSAIEKVRVAEKESVLLKGRQIDSEAKEITKIVEEMISVHELPILEIEAEEAARIEAIKKRIESLNTFKVYGSGGDKQVYIDELKSVKAFVIDDSLGEFQLEAAKTKEAAIAYLEQYIIDREKYEAEQAELASLRAEAAQREQKEREERIAKEAADNARIAAEKAAADERQRLADEQARKDAEAQAAIDKANREKLEAESARIRQEQQAKEAAERAERDRLAAIAKAEADKQAAIEAERKRQSDAVEAERLETEKRERNKAHVGQKRKEAKESLMAACGVSEEVAKAVVLAIASGKIDNVSIAY